MMKMKKVSAALLAVMMLVSMLSCMVFTASAANSVNKGEPVTVEKMANPESGFLTGAALPANVLIVNAEWAGSIANTPVFLKLDGTPYRGSYGVNAFSEIADAVTAAKSNDTIYVAAGLYYSGINLTMINNLKIYGPFAGVCPNDPAATNAEGLRNPNPARPDADNMNPVEASETEAVYYGTVNMISVASNPDAFTTLQGLYFAGNSTLSLGNGGVYRIGTILRNNVVNVSTTQFINMNRGMNPGFVCEYNRVINAKQFHGTGGFMGSIHRGNYFNLSDFMFYPGSMQNGSVGQIALIEGNYFEECNGIFYYGPNNYQVVSYSVKIVDNYINSVGQGKYIVNNEYDAFHSQPGITFQITGNEFHGIPKSTVLFQFPYRESEHNLNRYRYIVNINDNIFDLPPNQTLVRAEMAGYIDCSNNTFLQGVAMKQFSYDAKDCEVVLYPYYDAEGNAIGDARITDVYGGTVDQEELTVTMHLGDYAADSMDLTEVITASGDIKVYKDATLATEVKDKQLTFDAYITTRYIAVLTPDGEIGNIYTLTVTKDLGTRAQLLNVKVNHSQAQVTAGAGAFTVKLPADVAFVDYDLMVSAGATYELYSDAAYTKALNADSNYIPYGVDGAYYTVYVKVTSEDEKAMGYYTVTFERERSALYDPSITGLIQPEGKLTISPDRVDAGKLWMVYRANNKLLGDTVFEFTTTPGASYEIKNANGKVVSTSAKPAALALKAGSNNFTVVVKDGVNENTINFVVENGVESSDTTITGFIGQAPVILDNTITVIAGGTSFNGIFETRSKYATVDVYADEAHTIKMTYSSTPVVEIDTNRIVDQRSFTLPAAHATNKYFVVCTAEDGTTEDYTLVITKNVQILTYKDVSEDAWYASAVQQASDAGILNGETSGEDKIFRPNDNASREEMATIIARLLGINGASFANVKLTFKDTKSISDWAADNVKVCKYYGIMNGSNEGGVIYFLPQNGISRVEVMAIVARMLGLSGNADLSAFKDASSIPSWATEEVKATVAAGVITGDENGYLNPNAKITRAEIATIVTRILDRI